MKVTRDAVWKEESQTELIAGWCLVTAVAAFLVFLFLVPSRAGAPPGGRLRVIGYAVVPLGVGIRMIAKARRRLHRK